MPHHENGEPDYDQPLPTHQISKSRDAEDLGTTHLGYNTQDTGETEAPLQGHMLPPNTEPAAPHQALGPDGRNPGTPYRSRSN